MKGPVINEMDDELRKSRHHRTMKDLSNEELKAMGFRSPAIYQDDEPVEKLDWPDPTPEMRASPEFDAVWECIKRWDVNVPGVYAGYMGATGNHVRAILDALAGVKK